MFIRQPLDLPFTDSQYHNFIFIFNEFSDALLGTQLHFLTISGARGRKIAGHPNTRKGHSL